MNNLIFGCKIDGCGEENNVWLYILIGVGVLLVAAFIIYQIISHKRKSK